MVYMVRKLNPETGEVEQRLTCHVQVIDGESKQDAPSIVALMKKSLNLFSKGNKGIMMKSNELNCLIKRVIISYFFRRKKSNYQI